MMKAIACSLAISCLLSASAAYSQEISETLAKPVRATLKSPKPPIELEFCVADAISRVGGAVPTVLHDGTLKTILIGYGHTPKIIVVLNKIEPGSTLSIYTKSGDIDERFVGYVKESCDL